MLKILSFSFSGAYREGLFLVRSRTARGIYCQLTHLMIRQLAQISH